MAIQRIVKPKTHAAKRALVDREPKVIENAKNTLAVRGPKTNEIVVSCLKDITSLKKPHSTYMGHKNPIRPFEDVTPLETMSQKHDASLFAFGSHNKKRPNNIVLGRMYDHHVLDMFEFGLVDYRALADVPGHKVASGGKPCLLFNGELFDTEHTFQRLKNFLVDFFTGERDVEAIRLAGIEHVISFTATDEKVYVRSYRIDLKKSGGRLPRVELEEIGPSMDLVLRRTSLGSADLFRRSCKQPKELQPKKVKNISKDVFGSELGQIHMERQDYAKLHTREMKGLRKGPTGRSAKKRKKKEGEQGGAKRAKGDDGSD